MQNIAANKIDPTRSHSKELDQANKNGIWKYSCSDTQWMYLIQKEFWPISLIANIQV